MEKKKHVGKLLAIAALAVIAVVAISLIFAGCATNIRTIDKNGDYYVGTEKIVVNVPTEGNSTAYNVEINTSDADYSGETLVETVERIRPAVVDVYASKINGTSYAGSGVIIGAADTDVPAVTVGASTVTAETAYDQYYIITNHHVIDNCTKFSVDLLFIADDDTETHDSYTATLIGGSPGRDIAVLRIDRKNNEKIVLADIVSDSDKVKVGTEVLAIGNPLGILGGTVSKGIVSATAREVNVGDIGTMTLMQTDTAINGGNSGGGLFDTGGRLVGIVNSGYETDSSGSSVEGLNFAIPANDALFAAKSLMETHSETDGTVTQYGYVAGDMEFGLTCNDTTFSNSTTSVNVTYAVSVASDSPLYGKIYSQSDWSYGRTGYYHAITAITVGGEKTEITKSSELTAKLDTAKIGDAVTFTVRQISSNGRPFGGVTLGTETEDITVTAVQYVYTI